MVEMIRCPCCGQLSRADRKRLQTEGIERAKAAGRYKGRPISINVDEILGLKEKGVSPTDIARQLRIGRASVYRALSSQQPQR